MKGCRPFTKREVQLLSKAFMLSYFPERNCAMLVVGIATGFRISELLSLKVCDVYQCRQIVDYITVAKRNVKRKIESRSIKIGIHTKKAIANLLPVLREEGYMTIDSFLFQSRKGGNAHIHRSSAWKILNHQARALQMIGPIGTHSMRKTKAKRFYDKARSKYSRDGRPMDAIRIVMEALGHHDYNSTIQYLSFLEEDIELISDEIDAEEWSV